MNLGDLCASTVCLVKFPMCALFTAVAFTCHLLRSHLHQQTPNQFKSEETTVAFPGVVCPLQVAPAAQGTLQHTHPYPVLPQTRSRSSGCAPRHQRPMPARL